MQGQGTRWPGGCPRAAALTALAQSGCTHLQLPQIVILLSLDDRADDLTAGSRHFQHSQADLLPSKVGCHVL